jgi:hypothetical protein
MKKVFAVTMILFSIILISQFNQQIDLVNASPLLVEPTTTTEGWLTDLEGNLITDQEGYFVLTISQAMINAGKIEANFNKFAELFLDDFKNESGTEVNHKLKIINNTGRKINYKDYQFTTENVLPRTNNLFVAGTGSFTESMNRAYGSAYSAMLTSITLPDFRTDLCIGVKGFDDKNINIMMVNLSCINEAVMDFYGVDAPYKINLQQMMRLENDLQAAGYPSYASYLKSYYNVTNLKDIGLEDIYNILGTTNGAQSAITTWSDNTIGGKPIPASELNKLTNDFKIWGIAELNMDPEDSDIYPYIPNFFIMETDPEVIAFAYEYLYENGLRFSFDQIKQPFDTTDSEKGRGGDFGIKAYIDKNPTTTNKVNSILQDMVIDNGASYKLDNITAGLYVPNSWNQNRLYDFGFKLTFETKLNFEITDFIPKTGGMIFYVSGIAIILILSGVMLIGYYSEKKKTDNSDSR